MPAKKLTSKRLSDLERAISAAVEEDFKTPRVERLPTREEAAQAARVILECNGWDLDQWTDGIFPSDEETTRALKLLAGY